MSAVPRILGPNVVHSGAEDSKHKCLRSAAAGVDNCFVPNELSRAINEAVIRRLAGDRSYQRGQDYYLHGHVESIEDHAGTVRASVRGTQDYVVELRVNDGMLDYSCDCPVGIEGTFCKHCVATALAWLNQSNRPPKLKRGSKTKEITLADAQESLLAEDKEAIVQTLVEWAKTDQRLWERLILRAARRTGAEAAVAAARRAFNKAIQIRGFVHYREMEPYARGIDDAIDSIGELLQDGLAAGVMELCESALVSLQVKIGLVDDSDGYVSGLLGRLQDIHHRACLEARPEPVALAGRLFHWELNSDFDVFFGAVTRYAEILGPRGMKAYQNLAEEEWAKVPVRTTADRTSEWGKYFRISHIMETLARLSGDLEGLVGVMSRDLSYAYNYLRIAEACREAGEDDKALEWAERGLKAFPEHTDNRLREFLAEEYHRRKRHDEAMSLMWYEFLERPGLESYRTLEKHAKKAGNWKAWRERALAKIQGRIRPQEEKTDTQPRPRWMRPDDGHSQLVEIFLYEGDVQSAWREAQEGGCSDNLWLQLAGAREKDHPEDAVPIYLKQAEVAVRTASSSVYDDAVDLLVKAAAQMKRMGRSEEFVRHLESLRMKYKIKRNFIKLLDEKQKLLYVS